MTARKQRTPGKPTQQRVLTCGNRAKRMEELRQETQSRCEAWLSKYPISRHPIRGKP